MSKIFEYDPFPRKVTGAFLLLQVAGMVIVVIFSFIDLFFLALAISFLTFCLFIALLFWLHSRYQKIPVVREKMNLERMAHRFQKHIQAEERVIQGAITERARLFHAEKEEIYKALKTLQQNYIEDGLAKASIQEADIPGVGPKLKERLAQAGLVNAAQVTDKVANISGFGEAKHQSLINWRNSILVELENTKPDGLSEEQLERIQVKHHALHNTNNATERRARGSKQILEHELISFKPRLQELAPLTFLNYFSHSLASHGIVAVLIAVVLIMTQVVSTVSAAASTAASMIASIPTATATHSPTGTMTQTLTATITSTSTNTYTLTITSTPTVTLTPTITSTPSATPTLRATFTLRPNKTATIAPLSGGGGGSICDPAYPTVCIPPPPPDLDCGDIPYRRFQVLSPDPHNFDRDADGIGCES